MDAGCSWLREEFKFRKMGHGLLSQISRTRVGLFAPSFRQSKQLYEYCVGYMQSNFGVDSHVYKLESELLDDPTHGNQPIMKFRNGSLIEPLPAGDGSKLRGRRFNIIAIDEAYNLAREFHVSHIMPMGNVKIGNRPTKIFYLTTSWYSDVYAYTILQSIAKNVARGRPDTASSIFNLTM